MRRLFPTFARLLIDNGIAIDLQDFVREPGTKGDTERNLRTLKNGLTLRALSMTAEIVVASTAMTSQATSVRDPEGRIGGQRGTNSELLTSMKYRMSLRSRRETSASDRLLTILARLLGRSDERQD